MTCVERRRCLQQMLLKVLVRLRQRACLQLELGVLDIRVLAIVLAASHNVPRWMAGGCMLVSLMQVFLLNFT